jgi:hypothetical protein
MNNSPLCVSWFLTILVVNDVSQLIFVTVKRCVSFVVRTECSLGEFRLQSVKVSGEKVNWPLASGGNILTFTLVWEAFSCNVEFENKLSTCTTRLLRRNQESLSRAGRLEDRANKVVAADVCG